MARRLVTVLMVAVGLLAPSLNAKTDAKADLRDAGRRRSIEQFNLGLYATESRHETSEQDGPQGVGRQPAGRLPTGAAQSPSAGIGVGVSIDLTFDDAQYTWNQGRHVAHWWNGETGGTAEVSVHFVYRDRPDTIAGWPYTKTGYNVYNAVSGGNWPHSQDIGCDLEGGDSIGFGRMPSMDMMHNGRVVMANTGYYFRTKPDGSRYDDNVVRFQGSEFSCFYGLTPVANVTWIDTSGYRSGFMDQSDGNYSRDPQVVTQWDGSNTIVHLVFGESNGTGLSGNDYVNGYAYRTWLYFRKVGNTASSGSWSSPQILDSNIFVSTSLAASPVSGKLAFVYTNPSYWGALLNEVWDRDVWCRQSIDYGLSWDPAFSITNYQNAITGHPDHFTAWLESQALYTSDDNLHVLWTADKTSADPYADSYAWHDFNQNLYHWDQASGDIVKVANGSFWEADQLTGSMNELHCGFGGSNVGYLGWATMGECDGKLYAIWSQIHERANRFPWRDAAEQPAPGVLDDCSVVGERLARANWEILMSVAQVSTPSLWDYPRNISNTYTPNCGIIGYPGHEDAEGPCGSEWKPSVEKYALDESGLSLTWPVETEVDMSPYGDYSGGWYLNMEYLDDQFPGPFNWGNSNPPATENSMKWVRLACVEPEEAPIIVVQPRSLEWPQWVENGMVDYITVTVVNEGNVVLNVTEVGYVETAGSGWLSASISPTPGAPLQVTAGASNTATFDISIDASAVSQTSWLDGELWLKSDAANNDSISLPIHILAAPAVEPMAWDTAQTHENMFDPYFLPEGECVALAVGNAGDLGWGAGGRGGANLDYTESELECGSRARDSIYLKAATAFTILADDASGANARLTQVYEDADQSDETGFDPIGDLGSIRGGLTAGGDYDSVYTGKFVNRDTTIAMERIVYAPRSVDPENDTINFVILYTKVYSGDGAGHNHLTLGNVCDWDIPAEDAPDNVSAVSISGGFVYVQGTDTTGTLSCQTHTNRYATEAFGGAYTSVEWAGDNCVNDEYGYHGAVALNQTLLQDTTHYRDGADLVPDGPMPDVWWDETAVSPGLSGNAAVDDQAVWLTYAQDQSLGAGDTLHYWTVLSTVRDGTLADLEAQVDYARSWYTGTVRGCSSGCCEGTTGDANGDGWVTVADISGLIDALFVSDNMSVLDCLAEADANVSGGATPTAANISTGDIDAIIDHLFISHTELPLCYSTDSPYGNTDEGNPDSLIASTPVLDVTTGLPRAAISVYSYNDAQNLDGAQVGLAWGNANASLDSAVFSPVAASAFDSFRHGYYKADLGESNASRRVQMSGNRMSSAGLAASPGRTPLITYYFSLNDWGQYDQLCLDLDSYLLERYVDATISEYAPVWVAGGCDLDIDSDGDGVLNDGDHSGVAGDNPCAPGESADCDDNCPYEYNPGQGDADLDGKGNPCDIEPAPVDHSVVTDEQGDLYYPVVADLDLDHFPDMVFSDPTLNGVFVAYSESGGGWEPPVRLSNTSPAAITIDFVNADTLPDVIAVTTSAVEVLFNHGGRDFSVSPPTMISAGFGDGSASDDAFGAASAPVPAVISGYFDDDEILDLAVAPGEILLGQGDGTFGSGTAFPFPFQAANVCDFDHDGRDDLAVLSGSEIKICLNDGLPSASFTEGFSVPVGQPDLQMSPAHAVADFDWDGWCDFAIVTPLADPADQSMITVVLWGENLWLAQTVGIPVQGLAYDLVVADPDRDGNLDIIVANGTESRLEVYFGDGNGNFSDPAFEPLAPGQDLTFALAALDLDRDGNPDFVSGASGGGDIQTAYSQNADDPIIADSGYFPMVATSFSDASITVINPDGFVISEYGRSVAGSDYRRVDANGDGRIDEQTVDYNVQPGVYTIRPVFEPGAVITVRVDLGEVQQATLFLNYDTEGPGKCDDGADLPFEVYPPVDGSPIAPPSGQPVRSLQPTINWDGLVAGPDPRYGFQMNTRHDFCGTMIEAQLGLVASEYTVQATLAEENVYYWSVLFDRNNDGQYEDVSSTYALYIVDCCIGDVGNVNLVGPDPDPEIPTIGDVSVLIDHLYINQPALDCIKEADINRSGGNSPADKDITIGDVQTLIDYLFITGPSLGLNPCPL